MRTDTTRHPLPARLHALASLAGLLERLEQAPATVSPEQYRGLVRQITGLLAEAEADTDLHRLLDAAPHTAVLYENLRYDIAGLCRMPLEAALNAEMAATAALKHAGRRA